MSLKELLIALPEAQTKPENTSTLNLIPNEKILAKKENIEIAGRVFIAWFIFNNDQLNKVALTLLPKEKQVETLSNSELINAIYTQYAVLLTAKYGEPNHAFVNFIFKWIQIFNKDTPQMVVVLSIVNF